MSPSGGRRDFERTLQRAVRRLNELHGGDFHGKLELHCTAGQLNHYTINATHKPSGGESVQIMEGTG